MSSTEQQQQKKASKSSKFSFIRNNKCKVLMDAALLFTCPHSQLMRANLPPTPGLTCMALNDDSHCLVKKENRENDCLCSCDASLVRLIY